MQPKNTSIAVDTNSANIGLHFAEHHANIVVGWGLPSITLLPTATSVDEFAFVMFAIPANLQGCADVDSRSRCTRRPKSMTDICLLFLQVRTVKKNTGIIRFECEMNATARQHD